MPPAAKGDARPAPTTQQEYLDVLCATATHRDGTTAVIFEPLDFIARLAALGLRPRMNRTGVDGICAPNRPHCGLVTPAKRGRGGERAATADPDEPTPPEPCATCGGARRVVACIENVGVIERIFAHLDATATDPEATTRLSGDWRVAATTERRCRHR